MSKSRDTVSDTGKAICIILMCCGHTLCPTGFSNFFYLFHMPFFFIVSGFFFSQKNVERPKDFIIKRLKRLYIPFVLGYLTMIILQIIRMKLTGNYDKSDFAPLIHDFFSQVLLFERADSLFLHGYWFLRIMFASGIIVLAYFWIANKFKSKEQIIRIVLFTLTFISLFVLIYNHIKLPVLVIQSSLCAILIYLGFIWKKLEVKLNVLLALSFGLILLIVSYFVGKGQLDISLLVLPNPILFLLYSIAGTYFVLGTSKLINRSSLTERVFGYIGRNTMIILLLNSLSISLINNVYGKITGGGGGTLVCCRSI